MENSLKDCLTLQISEENANSPDFDLANYMNKKIKETLFKKAMGLDYQPTSRTLLAQRSEQLSKSVAPYVISRIKY